MVVVEENKPYEAVIGSPAAPYLDSLATRYASLSSMDAGYPPSCPSLAAYVILTSGDDGGICDDRNPSAHPLDGDQVFSQVEAAGGEWRLYAEGITQPCQQKNGADRRFLVRHAPAAYYVPLRASCEQRMVALGTPDAGALSDDVAAGSLPDLSFVVPDGCDDMHGGRACTGDQVTTGDDWLAAWVPRILSGPDFAGGRLVVVITWDEGSRTDNHIPTLVLAPPLRGVTASRPYTHCSTLRSVEELLSLPLLGCAGTAASWREELGL